MKDKPQEKAEDMDAILRLRKRLKPDEIPVDKRQRCAEQLWAYQKNLRKKVKKLSMRKTNRVGREAKSGWRLRKIRLKVPLEKAVYRLLNVYGLPQGGGDPEKSTIDYLFEFEGCIFDVYDYYCEHISLGFISPIETPLNQLAEMRKRGKTPPEEPPPDVTNRLQKIIEDLVNYPVISGIGAMI